MLRKIRDRVAKSSVAKAIVTLATGQALAQAIGLLTTPVVSRIYSVQAFGVYSRIVSMSAIVCTLTQLGLSASIMLEETDDSAKKTLTSIFFVQTALTVVAVFAGMIAQKLGYLHTDGASALAFLGYTSIYALTNNMVSLLSVYMNRCKRYRVLFFNALINALATLLITIPLGLLKDSYQGLMLAAIASQVICILQMLRAENPIVSTSFSEIKVAFKRHNNLVRHQFPANVLDSLSLQLPNQMIGMQFGDTNLGGYAMSQKIFNIPIRLIASPISTVYFREASDPNKSKEDLRRFTEKLVSRLLALAAIPVLILLLYGDKVFALALGQKWAEAGRIAALFSLGYAFNFASQTVSYCLVSLGKTRTNLLMAILHVLLIIVPFMAASPLALDFSTTLFLFSLGYLLYNATYLVVCFHYLGSKSWQHAIGYVLYCGGLVGISMFLKEIIS